MKHLLRNLRTQTARSARIAVLSAVSITAAISQTPPYAQFQYSTMTGSGNTISATHIPVVTATGATIYVNMTLGFNVDASGKLTVEAGYPQLAPAPVVSSFRAGKYMQAGTSNTATIAGPGVTAGGATEWTLASNWTYPYSATWYVGPITTSPIAARIQKAGVTSTAWSYGIAGGTSEGYSWSNSALIGASQIGNTITFVSFSDNYGDHSQPVAQFTYTLQP